MEHHDVITRALSENYASIARKFTQPVYSIFVERQERARAFSSTLWIYFLRKGLDETDSFKQLHHPALLHKLSTEIRYTVSSVCLLHEQVFAIAGWEAERHTGHIQQCWHMLHRWEEHGRSQKTQNIYHGHQTPPGGTPILQRQAILKYIGGPRGGLQLAATSVRFSAKVLSGLVLALQGKCRYFQLIQPILAFWQGRHLRRLVRQQGADQVDFRPNLRVWWRCVYGRSLGELEW